jgi:hypothetical protein
MKIITNEAGLITVEQEYPLVYTFSDAKWDTGPSSHINMAELLFEKKEHLSTFMVIVEAEHLADEHYDDPAYIHKTNTIGICRAQEKARDSLGNRWFKDDELTAIIEKKEFPTWKYNYQEQPKEERDFKHQIEDALFSYQEIKEMFNNIISDLSVAKYKLDEEGFILEYDDDDYDDYHLETDPQQVGKNRELLLERLLMPRVLSEHKRVYAMPKPFSHWDSRSFWHQFFFVENHNTKETLWDRGHGGGSGTRESNGRWSHTFAYLEKMLGVKTPTWHLIYNSHNQLVPHAHYDSFKSLRYDLTGNYDWDYKESKELFEGFLVEPARKD